MDDEVNRQGDCFPGASVREADICRQDTVRQPRQRLIGVVRVDRRQTSEVPGVERLEQIERFRSAYLTYQDAVGPVPQRRSNEVGDGHRRHGLLLAEGRLRSPGLEANEVGL